jgi:hypothetical protein
MLGQASRPSKSIPSVIPVAPQVTYPDITTSKPDQHVPQRSNATVDDDDDWIKPLPSSNAQRPALPKSHAADVMEDIHDKETVGQFGLVMKAPEPNDVSTLRKSPGPKAVTSPICGHVKSASTTVLPSPSKAAMNPSPSHTKTISVSNPTIPLPSTTPADSPRRYQDGPLSASKMKIQSIMKTAKGLFTSSAGISAAAKMETLSPSMKMLPNMTNGLYPNLEPAKQRTLPPSPIREDGRRTRSSTEREQKKKEQEAMQRQKVDDELEKARDKERQKAAQFKQDRNKALPSLPTESAALPTQSTRSSPRKAPESRAEEAPQPAEEKSIPRPTSTQPPQRPNQTTQLRRPVMKPSREALAKQQVPQPTVQIKLNHRVPLSTAALAQKLEDTLPPPAAPKQTGLMKKASTASATTTTSSTSFRSSTSTKPKALLAAEKKKEQVSYPVNFQITNHSKFSEQEERERQRREDQKAELARKRAAQQEQARREEQKQRAEAEKRERERVAIEEAKKTAQREAIEKRRLENKKKEEEIRVANSKSTMVCDDSDSMQNKDTDED